MRSSSRRFPECVVGASLVLAAVLVLTSAVPAQQSFQFEFDQDGVLPSAHPVHPAFFFNPSGLAESSQYSVSGGLLEQRTFGVVGGGCYIVGNQPGFVPPSPFAVDPSQDLVYEVRVRILQIEGQGAFLQAADGVRRCVAIFDASGVSVGFGAMHVPLDVFQFHTYRFRSPGGSDQLEFSIDGSVVVQMTSPPSGGLNAFNWTDHAAASGNSADADWEFVRLFQVPVQPAMEIPRLGTPPNPADSLRPGQTSPPKVGATWDPTVAPGFLSGAVLDVLAVSVTPVNVPLPFGTLLVDITSSTPILSSGAPGVPFAIPIPPELKLVGRTVSAQAASVRVLPGPFADLALTNALDITIGSS